MLGGRSPKAVLAKAASPSERRRALPLNLVITVASYLFLAALVVLLARTEMALALRLHHGVEWLSGIAPRELGLFAAHLGTAAILIAIVSFTALRINVNRFSIHALYRNRLVRAYLGAPRHDRAPDSFTGFDFKDDTRVAQLVCRNPAGQRRLFHVINACANLSGGRGSIAQERQALSFTITPLRCGGADLSSGGAYADAERYGSNEPNWIAGSQGIHLGTAMTISGAAANSSMGCHSSPATALLLTMFNVRLGAWLPNPAWQPVSVTHLHRSGPGFALRPLFVELLGRVSTSSKYLQLSDGGHFENLGVYEMVCRRCRFILVSDAGCDPKAHFEDRGNAIRRCRIDFGVDITFNDSRVTSRTDGKSGDRPYAIGRIDHPGEALGVLIYLKPTFHQIVEAARRMPIDVGHYASEHADFPHETTADQWFSESQFETYRRLGLLLASDLLKQLALNGSFASLIKAARAQA